MTCFFSLLPLWWPGGIMASRLLDRLKRSLFKDGQGLGPAQEESGGQEEAEFNEDRWEAELAEDEECVTDRLGGTLCFEGGVGGLEDGAEGEGSGQDSDSDFLGESMEEGPSSTGEVVFCSFSSNNLKNVLPSDLCLSDKETQLQLFTLPKLELLKDFLQLPSLYTIHVIQSGGSDKTPAIITRRYSDFQRLHATLRRNHGEHMERVCFPRKKLRRNFTAETIAKRSRAFEQYLSHLCSLQALRGALCVRQFFYLTDLQTGQLLIRAGRYQEALGPLLNAKRLQHKLGWASYYDNQAQTNPSLMVRLSWQTGRDKRQWEELLQHLEERWVGLDNHPTIKEFLVKHNLQDSGGEG
uniref:Sorting nexin family member 21 n=1 Tax=Amphilophus citrinellus TaxID=61819 RepID=A0A3Q0QNF2_AMPCI